MVGKLQVGDRIRIKYYKKKGNGKPYRMEDLTVISLPAGKDYFVVNNGNYTKTVDWIWKRQGLIEIFKIKIKEVEQMPERKITRDQLLDECKEHGTNMIAAEFIAQKYGLAPSTVYTDITKLGVRKELEEGTGIKPEKKPRETKPDKSADMETPVKTRTEKPILQSAYLRGKYADYKIHEKTIQMVDKKDEGCFLDIPKTKEALNGFIMEVDELLARIEEEAS